MENAVASLSSEGVKETSKLLKAGGLEPEQIRSKLERALRARAMALGASSAHSVEHGCAFLSFVISLAKEEICTRTLTVQVLQDIFDVSPIKRCEELFSIVEDNIAIWKTPFFFDSCKNLILRMCNDLLKRLSRTVDTSFCGRILVLLAKSLPLNEKSGLNLPGQFNTANVTLFEPDQTPASSAEPKVEVEPQEEGEPKPDEDMEIGEIRETNTIDSALYGKFWEIQPFFVNPNQLQDSTAFKKFESNLQDVLAVFSSYKLEKPSNQSSQSNKERSVSAAPLDNGRPALNGFVKAEPGPSSSSQEESGFFAKYLTNQKLFDLQLADSQFRRYFLCQCMILVNYLTFKPTVTFTATMPVGVKGKEMNPPTLLPAEETALKAIGDKCAALLKETHPHGTHFAESIKRILARERMWSTWKNDSCPDLVDTVSKLLCESIKKKQLMHYNPNPKMINLGSKELTRLWRINPVNMEACRAQNRNLAPPLKDFLHSGLQQMDPEEGVEEEYKEVNDEKYQWMASRFLLAQSDYYINSVVITDNLKGPRMSTAQYLEKAILISAQSDPELKDYAKTVDDRVKDKLLADENQRKADEEAKKVAEEEAKQAAEEEARQTAEEAKRAAEEAEAKKAVEESQKAKEARKKNGEPTARTKIELGSPKAKADEMPVNKSKAPDAPAAPKRIVKMESDTPASPTPPVNNRERERSSEQRERERERERSVEQRRKTSAEPKEQREPKRAEEKRRRGEEEPKKSVDEPVKSKAGRKKIEEPSTPKDERREKDSKRRAAVEEEPTSAKRGKKMKTDTERETSNHRHHRH